MNRRNIYGFVRFVLGVMMLAIVFIDESMAVRAIITLTCITCALLAMSLNKKYAYPIYGALALFYAFLTISSTP
jgi:hypothetical protein